ncbi:MAG TPA: AmmeMemoRadiSam system protein A [Verrucomicrobiae bacterium]|nr:AmmeMemoRadiSam system protein A [Verrucomicrobiae bacterium]
MSDYLDTADQQTLLNLAREAVRSCILREAPPAAESSSPALNEHRGCFVCIKIGGMLRGCIGNFTSETPLYRLVQEMAQAAACRDPRFYPMKEADLQDFALEISVLTPMRKIESVEEIEVGTHGLYIEKNSFRGVLLPQVATEYGWDRDTFLAQTCVKAGLKRDDWKDGADIYVFAAQVFGDA